MRRAEYVMAVVMAIFSLYLMWKSAELPIGWEPKRGPGGGAFPFWLSLGMLDHVDAILLFQFLVDRRQVIRSPVLLHRALELENHIVQFLYRAAADRPLDRVGRALRHSVRLVDPVPEPDARGLGLLAFGFVETNNDAVVVFAFLDCSDADVVRIDAEEGLAGGQGAGLVGFDEDRDQRVVGRRPGPRRPRG